MCIYLKVEDVNVLDDLTLVEIQVIFSSFLDGCFAISLTCSIKSY